MYKIRGADQKEYGPVTADHVRQWIAEGRANSRTQVQPAGSAEWQELGTLPEFAALFNVSSRLPSPPPGLAPSATPRTSGLAITSLVLGLLGFVACGLTALPGLICGIIAMVRVKKSNGTLTGEGLALAGTLLSAFSLIIGVILAAMLLPALATAKNRAQTIVCVNNVKQLALAVRIHSADHTNHFPSASSWCDAIKPYAGSERVFKCPDGDVGQRCHYAFNAKLDGIEDNQVNSQTVLLFETEGGWNVSGGRELMLSGSRHQRKVVVAFADGSVRQLRMDELAGLRWDP